MIYDLRRRFCYFCGLRVSLSVRRPGRSSRLRGGFVRLPCSVSEDVSSDVLRRVEAVRRSGAAGVWRVPIKKKKTKNYFRSDTEVGRETRYFSFSSKKKIKELVPL